MFERQGKGQYARISAILCAYCCIVISLLILMFTVCPAQAKDTAKASDSFVVRKDFGGTV